MQLAATYNVYQCIICGKQIVVLKKAKTIRTYCGRCRRNSKFKKIVK